jgi:hypothetical protein
MASCETVVERPFFLSSRRFGYAPFPFFDTSSILDTFASFATNRHFGGVRKTGKPGRGTNDTLGKSGPLPAETE